MDRTWQTRVAAIVMIGCITMLATWMGLDGIWTPLAGVAVISAIAGYETGLLRNTGRTK